MDKLSLHINKMTRASFIRALFTCTILVLWSPLYALPQKLQGVNDWLYVLSLDNVSISQIANSGFDLVVMDYSKTGDEADEFTPAEIAQIKAAGMTVLAYLSIGEAEDYRFYWQSGWTPGNPAWLGPQNPEWAGNYKVRYWQSGWQDILFGTASGPNKDYLDRIIDQGFDGIYLDIIDAYEYWGPDDQGELTRTQARTYMKDLVLALRTYARTTRGVSDFLIFPQNGPEIIYNDSDQVDTIGQSYLSGVDGIGQEDTWYDETTAQPPGEVSWITTLLDLFKTYNGDRLVLSVDYVWNQSNPGSQANKNRYNDYHSKAQTKGYIPYAAHRNRDLDEINTVTISSGINYSQPRDNPTPTPTATFAGPTPTPTITKTPTLTPTITRTPTITTTPTMTRTPTITATATISPVRVNFQPPGAATPAGFWGDDGSGYGTHGPYGWN